MKKEKGILPSIKKEYNAWNSAYADFEPQPFRWGALPNTPEIIDFFEKNHCYKLLDAGCGDGGQMLPLLDKFLVVGVDQSQNAIDAAHFNLINSGKRNYVLYQSLIQRMSFANSFFDAAILKDELMMFRNPSVILKSLHKAISPGGFLVISTFAKEEMAAYNNLAGTRWISKSACIYDDNYYIKFYSSREFHLLLNRCGFDVVNSEERCDDDEPHLNFRDDPHQHHRIIVIAQKRP